MNETPRPPERRPDIDEEDLRPHVFDGIQEYDKKLPNWWLMTLYGTIVFSILYWFFYHTFQVGLTPSEMLQVREARAEEWKIAQGLGEASNESLFAMSFEASVTATGERLYQTHCAACHGANGGGMPGFPSLIDNDWIHGGSPMEIRHIILEGVPDRGMIAWRNLIGERGAAEITAFLIQLNPYLSEEAESQASANGQPNDETE